MNLKTTPSETVQTPSMPLVDLTVTVDDLLEVAYLSNYHLNGALQIRGFPSVRILLGQLFPINRKHRAT